MVANQNGLLSREPVTSTGLLPSNGSSNCNGTRPGKHPKASISAVAWRARSQLSFAEWVEQGRRLGIIGRSVAWWIGDWLNWGNAAYGERYVRAARITGYDAQTLMNMSYVASRFDISRRRENLSWSHHAELAALEPKQQDRWLDRAKDDRLSVRCLRDELRRERLVKARKREELEAPAKAAANGAGTTQKTGAVCPRCGFHLREADEAK